VLVQVANLLRSERRVADQVGRFGGEEFCLLFPGEDNADLLGQRLTARIRRHQFAGLPSVTISVGLAIVPAGAKDGNWDALVHDADQALYIAKRGGRDRHILAGQDKPGAPALLAASA